MKVLIFNSTKEEVDYIKERNIDFGFELDFADFDFNAAGMAQFQGYDALWIVTNCKITAERSDIISKAGVKYIASRAAGTDHMDIAAMKSAGLLAANVPRYSPNAIAEHTVCLILMALRKMKRELRMIEQYDFSLTGLKGRELRNLTVGILGTGRIGAETIQLLSGFGCRLLAYDLYENSGVAHLVTYCEQQQLLEQSDILVLHCPLTKENERLINSDSIAKMKEGVVIINTARGGVMDYAAVLKELEQGKISAVAFDVYDNEGDFIRKKVEPATVEDQVLKKLLEKDNVIYTAHMSFFTDTAIENMILSSLENLQEYRQTGVCSNEIIL